MNGIHDMGGMNGFGPIVREEGASRPDAWEDRVNAIVNLTASQGYFTKDAFRHGVERIEPERYLRAPYYERWLASLEDNLSQNGLLTTNEIDARIELLRQQPDAAQPHATAPPPSAPNVSSEPAAPPPAPRFGVGDAVMTRNLHPTGHTRLPRYARGKRGVIQASYGPHTFPDTNAHGLGPNPHALYSVRFDGRELWGEAAEPGAVVHLDLWDSYLDPAPS